MLTKFIDLLMLLNCAYIAVFICTFADPLPQLEQGAIYILIALLPALLNVLFLIPALIFYFSLISAVCQLDTAGELGDLIVVVVVVLVVAANFRTISCFAIQYSYSCSKQCLERYWKEGRR